MSQEGSSFNHSFFSNHLFHSFSTSHFNLCRQFNTRHKSSLSLSYLTDGHHKWLVERERRIFDCNRQALRVGQIPQLSSSSFSPFLCRVNQFAVRTPDLVTSAEPGRVQSLPLLLPPLILILCPSPPLLLLLLLLRPRLKLILS